MAHSGKVYPVHFRRDFNLNCKTNNIGFARAYSHDFFQALGVVGVALHNHPLICIARDEPTYAGMKWESDFEPRGGHYVKFKCSTVDPTGTLDIRIDGQLIDQTLGPLGDARVGFEDAIRYGDWNFRWVPFSFPYPDLFGVTFNAFTQMNAVRWAQWNNL